MLSFGLAMQINLQKKYLSLDLALLVEFWQKVWQQVNYWHSASFPVAPSDHFFPNSIIGSFCHPHRGSGRREIELLAYS